MEVPAEHRRPLAHLLLHQTVERAAMLEHPAVAEVLATVTPHGPGRYTRALEAAQRRWSKASFDLWVRHDHATNGGGERPFPEEDRRVNAAYGVGKALQLACSEDDLTALLGVADMALGPAQSDKLKADFVAIVREVSALPPEAWPAAFARLPAPATAAERDQQLVDQRQAREDELRRWQEEEDDDDVDDDDGGWDGVIVFIDRQGP